MKIIITLLFLFFIFTWLGALALLAGYIPIEVLPSFFAKIELPKNFALLGEAMGVLDGLFSSIAILLGLVAILLQGKELKNSTQAQTEQARELKISTQAQAEQAKALTKQISKQEEFNKLAAYSARLKFLTAEINYLDTKVNEMEIDANKQKAAGKDEDANKTWTILRNTRAKQQRYREQAEQTDKLIQEILGAYI